MSPSTETPQPSDAKPSTSALSPVDLALARAQVYHFLSVCYRPPNTDAWNELGDAAALTEVLVALRRLGISPRESLLATFRGISLALLQDAYRDAFGHSIHGRCPPYEAEYGAGTLDFRQCLELSDIAGFYRAFGLKISSEFHDRPDHIVAELEFMGHLAVKEAYALIHALPNGEADTCRAAQEKFLEQHLGLWIPSFSARLEENTSHDLFRLLASLTREFVRQECLTFHVTCGDGGLAVRRPQTSADQDVTQCSTTTDFVPLEAISVRRR